MRGYPADVADNCGRAVHQDGHRGVSDLGDKNVALPELEMVLRAFNDAHLSLRLAFRGAYPPQNNLHHLSPAYFLPISLAAAFSAAMRVIFKSPSPSVILPLPKLKNGSGSLNLDGMRCSRLCLPSNKGSSHCDRFANPLRDQLRRRKLFAGASGASELYSAAINLCAGLIAKIMSASAISFFTSSSPMCLLSCRFRFKPIFAA